MGIGQVISITSWAESTSMLQLEGECYSIVELETSWEKETCIHVELGTFIFFPLWFKIVLYRNRLFVINEKQNSSFNYL